MRNFSHQQGPKAYQNAGQLVRAYFGLTQQNLARLLGVSRGMVAMDERGERHLPAAAWARLHELFMALPAPDGPAPVPAVPAPTLTEADRRDLKLRLMAIELEAYPARKKLARCEARLAQACLWQQALPGLRAALPDERTRRWLESFEEEALSNLSCDTGSPALLRLRLDTLAFEADGIARLLAEHNPDVSAAGEAP